MNKKLRSEAVDHLFDAILCLKDREECYTFFEDVCTINEILSLSQRFEVAKMLRDQKTYLDIAEKTGASTATISRVNRSLNYGNDGYDMVFARICKDEIRPYRGCRYAIRQTRRPCKVLFMCVYFRDYIIDDFFNQTFFHIDVKTE